MYVYDDISLSFPRMRFFSDKNLREFQNAHRVVYEIMWKNMVETDRPQMTIKQGACALHAGYLKLQTHTRNT